MEHRGMHINKSYPTAHTNAIEISQARPPMSKINFGIPFLDAHLNLIPIWILQEYIIMDKLTNISSQRCWKLWMSLQNNCNTMNHKRGVPSIKLNK
jgi:hypothetical protein